jgi:hypothetical protein
MISANDETAQIFDQWKKLKLYVLGDQNGAAAKNYDGEFQDIESCDEVGDPNGY